MLSRLISHMCKLKIHQRCFRLQVQNSRWLQLGGARLATMTEGEKRIADILTKELEPTFLEVRDISGGCGSMYEILIDSELFKGKRMLQQHQMVNRALGDEVKTLHGLTIRTGKGS